MGMANNDLIHLSMDFAPGSLERGERIGMGKLGMMSHSVSHSKVLPTQG